MVKLSQILSLLEEFSGSKNVRRLKGHTRVDAELFTNPEPSEMQDTYKASKEFACIRFYVDFKKKEVVIWQGDVSHRQILRSLGLFESWPKFFTGTATFKSGKMMTIVGSDRLQFESPPSYVAKILKQIEGCEKWLSKYFINVKEFTNTLKKEKLNQ